jgi:hypothetical protein
VHTCDTIDIILRLKVGLHTRDTVPPLTPLAPVPRGFGAATTATPTLVPLRIYMISVATYGHPTSLYYY